MNVDWAADESCADIVRWNAGVDRVLSAPLRRYKASRRGVDLQRIARAICELRAVRYDAVLDIHWVYKSAIIGRLERGKRRFGYRGQNLGERGAAFAYTDRFGPSAPGNAWTGRRVSVGEALGYVVDTPPDFDLRVPLRRRAGDGPLALLFHGMCAAGRYRSATACTCRRSSR